MVNPDKYIRGATEALRSGGRIAAVERKGRPLALMNGKEAHLYKFDSDVRVSEDLRAVVSTLQSLGKQKAGELSETALRELSTAAEGRTKNLQGRLSSRLRRFFMTKGQIAKIQEAIAQFGELQRAAVEGITLGQEKLAQMSTGREGFLRTRSPEEFGAASREALGAMYDAAALIKGTHKSPEAYLESMLKEPAETVLERLAMTPQRRAFIPLFVPLLERKGIPFQGREMSSFLKRAIQEHLATGSLPANVRTFLETLGKRVEE